MDVDSNSSLRIGFIGAGRVASALARGMARAGYSITDVASRSESSARSLAASLPACRMHKAPQGVVSSAQLVFLTVPDDVIESLTESLQWHSDVAVVHCSGVTELSALGAARRAGAQVGGFHPMQNFAVADVALNGLSGCSVATEALQPLLSTLQQLATALGMRAFQLPPGARALYHLSGSFAASFIDVLLHEAMQIWARFGMPPETALKALIPLARGTLDSIDQLGTIDALTGPISRGDVGTVRRHIDALEANQSTALPLYLQLAQRSVTMACADGKLGEHEARAIEHILDEARNRRV